MAPPLLLRVSTRPCFYVCARCAFRASNASSKTTKRWITHKYLTKVADAELEWREKASGIRSGKGKSMLTILEERGLVQTVTGKRDDVDRMMTDRRLGAYVGIDPTAPSLHVGHMIPLMSLFWMYVHGYHTVSLIGGATAKIGDPTDRLTTREKEHPSVGTANMTSMHSQLKQLWRNVEQYGRKYGYEQEWAWRRELINNNVWWNSLPMLQVLQLLGPGMRMGSMLARDTVKNKMSKGDGMSWAEFSYPIMQAWDWWHMFHTKNIQMQIGGSDQFGNITAGIDAVKYISTHHPDPLVRDDAKHIGEPFGFTVPLLTTSSGQKFGKSAGNAIWLDSKQTSPFELYKYFLGTADADAEKYLKIFTFMPLEDISALVKTHMESPGQRKAQHKLAREFVGLIHGEEEAKLAEAQHHLLFKNPGGPVPTELEGARKAGVYLLDNRPTVNVKVPRSLMYQRNIGKILFGIGVASSATLGHRLVRQGAVYIGGPRPESEGLKGDYVSWSQIKEWVPWEIKKYFIHDDLLLFRRSKTNVRVVQVISDEKYAMSGATYPGLTLGWRAGILKALSFKDHITKEEKKGIDKLLAEDALSMKTQEEEQSVKNAAKTDDELISAGKEDKTLPKVNFVKKPKEVEAEPAAWVDRL